MASQSRSAVSSEQVQTALSRVLLQKIRQDQHPSYTQMTMLEQMLPPSLYREYVTVLLEKVLHDDRPSTTMIRRIQGFASQIP
jgi:predicted  nucleic acid-binding Zn-ribbon protein